MHAQGRDRHARHGVQLAHKQGNTGEPARPQHQLQSKSTIGLDGHGVLEHGVEHE